MLRRPGREPCAEPALHVLHLAFLHTHPCPCSCPYTPPPVRNAELQALVVERSTIGYMKQFPTKCGGVLGWLSCCSCPAASIGAGMHAAQAGLPYLPPLGRRYDEHMLKFARNEFCGRPRDAGLQNGKVREGKQGCNREALTLELRQAIQEKWEEVVLPATGYRTYEEMRLGINTELGRPFGRGASE